MVKRLDEKIDCGFEEKLSTSTKIEKRSVFSEEKLKKREI